MVGEPLVDHRKQVRIGMQDQSRMTDKLSSLEMIKFYS